MTFIIQSLSATVDDKVIAVTPTTAVTAITIHTAVDNGTDFDEIELHANNHLSTARELVLIVGGETTAEEIRVEVPAKKSKLVLAGRKISSGNILKAYCTIASGVNVWGKAGRNS